MIPEPDRVKTRELALKIYTQRNDSVVATEVDCEVTQILGVHMRFERIRPELAAAAVPLRPPIPQVFGLHSAEVEGADGVTSPRVAGFFLEQYSMSVLSLIQRGTLSIGDFLRILSTVTVGVGVIQKQQKVPRELCEGGNRTAGDVDSTTSDDDHGDAWDDGRVPHLGGIHCDLKPGNILVQVRPPPRLPDLHAAHLPQPTCVAFHPIGLPGCPTRPSDQSAATTHATSVPCTDRHTRHTPRTRHRPHLPQPPGPPPLVQEVSVVGRTCALDMSRSLPRAAATLRRAHWLSHTAGPLQLNSDVLERSSGDLRGCICPVVPP